VNVAEFFGLACMAPSQSTDAMHPGILESVEKAVKGFTVTATQPDHVTGIGMLHAAQPASLEACVAGGASSQARSPARRLSVGRTQSDGARLTFASCRHVGTLRVGATPRGASHGS
jgi:uncharacterized protein involved in copper resistance